MKVCPRCETELVEEQLGQVRIDGCNGCGGVWFDNDELGMVANGDLHGMLALEDFFLPGADAPVGREEMSCPACQVKLYPFQFPHSPGITLDACPQCKGIWADNGELEAMHHRLTGMQRAPAASVPNARHVTAFLESVPCSHCKQPNPRSSISCWACGSKQQANGKALCPNCHVGLRERFYFDRRIDVCPSCTGVWLEAGELSALAERSPAELQQIEDDHAATNLGVSAIWENDLEPELPCPRCCCVMREHQYAYSAAIRVEFCERCDGVWVGAGKLRLLSRYYNQTLGSRRLG